MSDIVERLRAEEQRMIKLFDVACVYRDRLEGKAFQDMNSIKHAISGRDPVLEPAADELARLCADMASLHDSLNKAEQDNEALRAREAELVEALELILPLAKGYNAIQAGAPRGCPESNRRYVECAEAALARVRTEKGET